jgi:hypothetical protein
MVASTVRGIALVMVGGAIAPFSAMSGAATKVISLLRAGVIQPSVFTVFSSALPSNAALLHAAAAAAGGSQPAASAVLPHRRT